VNEMSAQGQKVDIHTDVALYGVRVIGTSDRACITLRAIIEFPYSLKCTSRKMYSFEYQQPGAIGLQFLFSPIMSGNSEINLRHFALHHSARHILTCRESTSS